jgi:hypothetical protein
MLVQGRQAITPLMVRSGNALYNLFKFIRWQIQRKEAHYGKPNPLGDIPDDGEGKSEEGEEIDFDGLLQ